ncbi:hypothetical protein BpHYR1_037647 [Brachionus plicatilis]|uniref:Uncharacterized protein n=1 Tax=Brachionus plicatilis TaxID=10195 RepID=A0A3M7RKJ5_BRAPC|nr:hypothetical protein BpHYR1_037647 [Brachionus plicatilis]
MVVCFITKKNNIIKYEENLGPLRMEFSPSFKPSEGAENWCTSIFLCHLRIWSIIINAYFALGFDYYLFCFLCRARARSEWKKIKIKYFRILFISVKFKSEKTLKYCDKNIWKKKN